MCSKTDGGGANRTAHRFVSWASQRVAWVDKNRVLPCSAVAEPDMVNENHLEEGEGRGDKMKMPQTVERTAGRQLVRKYSTEGFFKDSPLAH